MNHKIFNIELIDGFGKEKAIMTKLGSIAGADKCNHCAHHGSNPFFCCKCGSEFKPVK